MRAQLVDPSAFTRPYDHALSAALARAGVDVELITSRFVYGAAPAPVGYAVRELFYRHAVGPPGSRRRQLTKLIDHVPDMVRYRSLAADADVVHFQWLAVQLLDRWLLPRRPLVLTAHDLLPREPRPGQVRAQRALYDAVDAIVVHTDHGRRRLVEDLGVADGRVHVIPHGAFEHLTSQPDELPLPAELTQVERPVVLFFGLLRPYKGVELLLDAFRGIGGAELWIVGRPRMPLAPLKARAPAGVRFVSRFVSDRELPAFFRRADVIVLPYLRTERFDQSGVLATALAFGKPIVASDVGGFGELAQLGAVQIVPPGDAEALRAALKSLLDGPAARERLAQAAASAARQQFSWDRAAQLTRALYERLA
jgi:glycosyltransferase involved in cell wall biosynthesis